MPTQPYLRSFRAHCLLGMSLFAAPFALADTITFSGAPTGNSLATYTEGNFTYTALDGGFGDIVFYASSGNHGQVAFGFGYDIYITDPLIVKQVGGGDFTYDSLDFAVITDDQGSYGPGRLIVNGLRGGKVVGQDVYSLDATTNFLPDGSPDNFTTEAATTLNGVTLDELDVEILGENYHYFNADVVDNIVLTPAQTPEPAAWLLLAPGLLALPALRRHGTHRQLA